MAEIRTRGWFNFNMTCDPKPGMGHSQAVSDDEPEVDEHYLRARAMIAEPLAMDWTIPADVPNAFDKPEPKLNGCNTPHCIGIAVKIGLCITCLGISPSHRAKRSRALANKRKEAEACA